MGLLNFNDMLFVVYLLEFEPEAKQVSRVKFIVFDSCIIGAVLDGQFIVAAVSFILLLYN